MTIEINGPEEFIQIAAENGWTVDRTKNDDLVVRDDETGVEYVYRGDGTLEAPALSTDKAVVDRSLQYGTDTYNPHPIRGPQQDGPPTLREHPDVSNPVITASDVTDQDGDSAADPFLFHEDGKYYLFFEIFGGTDGEDIALATSDDGLKWTYEQVVLSDGNHFAYPYVFKWDGEYYMSPARGADGGWEIYRADSFPTSWSLVETPLSISTDPTPFYWQDRWYVYQGSGTITLHYSEPTEGPPIGLSWTEHPSSPIYDSVAAVNKPAGRPLVHDDYIDIPVQDTSISRGDIGVGVRRITQLSTTEFSEQQLNTVGRPPRHLGWNHKRMHHMDLLLPESGPALAVMDGMNTSDNYSLGLFTIDTGRSTPFKQHLNSVLSISPNTWTKVPVDGLGHDYEHTYDTASSVFITPATGVYDIDAMVNWIVTTSNGPYKTIARIQNVTQSETIVKSNGVGNAVNEKSQALGTQEFLNEGDNLELQVWHNSSASEDLQNGAEKTFMSVNRVR